MRAQYKPNVDSDDEEASKPTHKNSIETNAYTNQIYKSKSG